jgi:hypothetical protein
MSAIIAHGLEEVRDFFDRLPQISTDAARMAINDVAGGTGLTLLRKAAYEEISFPSGYLNKDRLGLASRATNSKLGAVIKGRDRPTSLARFVDKKQVMSGVRGNLRVTVKPGKTKTMSKSWLVNLKNGNLGLAIRLAPGERLNKTAPPSVELSKGVYLLYGPSVEQVFKGVAADNSGEIARLVSREFLRQIARLSRG